MPLPMGESGCGYYQWVRDLSGNTVELGYALIMHIVAARWQLTPPPGLCPGWLVTPFPSHQRVMLRDA